MATMSPFRGLVRANCNKPRPLSNASFSTHKPIATKSPDMSYVNIRNAPNDFDVSSAVVYPSFLTDDEARSLAKEASRRLKRRRFEEGHWDAVIKKYREVEMTTPREQMMQQSDDRIPLFAQVIDDVRRHLTNNHFKSNCGNVRWLPCHAIDLSAEGELSAHVDSVKFSGEIVAGVSLLSDSIMRLRPSSDEWNGEQNNATTNGPISEKDGYVDLYLPRLSLYVLSGMSRFYYTHELLPSGSTFEFPEVCGDRHIDVLRDRRLSIIFRDAHQHSTT